MINDLKDEWVAWFAWYPVPVNVPGKNKWRTAWLETVERRFCKSGGWDSDVYIKYREKSV